MEDRERSAARDVPRLRKWSQELLSAADDFIDGTSGKEYPHSDHFAFMLLTFLCKQANHMHSILRLGTGYDSSLVARSMLEGMAQLLWTAKEPQTRAERWRAYSVVHDWRKLQYLAENNQPVDSGERAAIGKVLCEVGEWFLTPAAKKRRAKGKKLPKDPYVKHWTGLSMWEVFKEADKADVYLTAYAQFCDWHHWSSGGLGRALVLEDDRISYQPASSFAEAGALSNGFLSLYSTLDVAEQHLDLMFRERIDSVAKDYLSEFGDVTEGDET